MLAATALFFLAAVALLVGPELAKLAGLGAVGQLIWTILRWPLTFLFVVGAFWIVYYLLPNRDQKGYSGTILKAAAVAAVLWVLASAVFRLYIANFSSYSETYGFLGAFIILLLWLYVTGLVVLAGGELASEMERGSESGG
jgi:membrane protein